MKRIKFYGAAFWAHCNPVKEYLLDKGIEFDYIDISESEDNKNEFLALREQYDEYNEIIEKGKSFGIPALFFDNEVVIGDSLFQINKMIEKYESM